MDAVAIGPLVFSVERFAVLAGIAVFMAAVWWFGRRADARLQLWSGQVLIWSFVAARLGHVARHWESFAGEPWRVLFFWQGGFWAPAGFAAAVMITGFTWWRVRGLLRPALLSLALALVAWQGVLALRAPLPEAGLPEQDFVTHDGGEVDLSQREGRALVLNIWASWCGPCRREMPMMAEVAQSHPGIDFVFANQREGAGVVRRYLSENALELDTVILDLDGALARRYAVLGLPGTLFIAPDGTVIERRIGELSREAFERDIAQLTAP